MIQCKGFNLWCLQLGRFFEAQPWRRQKRDEEDQHGPGTNCWAQDYALIFNCWYQFRFNNNTTKYNFINIFKTRKQLKTFIFYRLICHCKINSPSNAKHSWKQPNMLCFCNSSTKVPKTFSNLSHSPTYLLVVTCDQNRFFSLPLSLPLHTWGSSRRTPCQRWKSCSRWRDRRVFDNPPGHPMLHSDLTHRGLSD